MIRAFIQGVLGAIVSLLAVPAGLVVACVVHPVAGVLTFLVMAVYGSWLSFVSSHTVRVR